MTTPTIRALVVDDSALYRKFVSSVLNEIQDVEVVGTATNGRIGLEKIQTLKPDLITLDLEMPNMDGFELAGRIKESKWSHLPVIALTSLAGSADVQRGIEVGIDDYQIKMDRDKLLSSLHNFAGSKAGNNSPALQTS